MGTVLEFPVSRMVRPIIEPHPNPFSHLSVAHQATMRPWHVGQRIIVTGGKYTGHTGTIDCFTFADFAGRADVKLDAFEGRRRNISVDCLAVLPSGGGSAA